MIYHYVKRIYRPAIISWESCQIFTIDTIKKKEKKLERRTYADAQSKCIHNGISDATQKYAACIMHDIIMNSYTSLGYFWYDKVLRHRNERSRRGLDSLLHNLQMSND